VDTGIIRTVAGNGNILLAVYDGSNSLLMRFEYADSRMPFAMTMGGALYYMVYDQIGSLKLIADSAGNVVKRVEYDTFGNIISDSSPSFNVPFGFAGGLHDRDTRLVRFGHRDYDPETGRWTAKDPIGFAGGDTDLYGYCVNDPVNWADPKGLIILPENPHGLPYCWKHDPTNRYPYGEQYVHPDGDTLEFHYPQPGFGSDTHRGQNHWHYEVFSKPINYKKQNIPEHTHSDKIYKIVMIISNNGRLYDK